MKTIQTSGWYFPESCGGTEVYINTLVEGLRALGVDSSIAAPHDSAEEASYDVHHTPVYRYPLTFPGRGVDYRSEVEPPNFHFFKKWLSTAKASIYHQHAWVPGCGLPHLKAARELGMKTVFSFHVVGPVCLRGDLRRHGRVDCDGEIIEQRCAACWASHRGWPAPLAWTAAHLPKTLSQKASHRKGVLASWASTRYWVDRHAGHLRDIALLSDRLVVSSPWMKELLVRNHLPEEKIRISSLRALLGSHSLQKRKATGPVRIGFLGRWYPLKGIDLLLQAAKRLSKSAAFELTVHGMANGDTDRLYARRVRRLAEGDSRIRFAGPVAHEAVFDALRQIDLLAVPSRGAETGPLVVLEALAAGTPVLCAPIGSTREWTGKASLRPPPSPLRTMRYR